MHIGRGVEADQICPGKNWQELKDMKVTPNTHALTHNTDIYSIHVYSMHLQKLHTLLGGSERCELTRSILYVCVNINLSVFGLFHVQ